VYVEKPIAPDADGAGTVLAEAARQGLKVGCAPDTVLSPAHTRCRALIESGAIGRPVAATGFMLCPGHESWHPDPAFYYQPGGGPLFDMGPYYLTALVRMLGPIARVSGAAGVQVTDRAVGRGPRRGEAIAVQTPDHVSATLEFASGAVGTLVTSFATRHAGHLTHSSGPEGAALPITVFGTRGTLRVPDPNCFEGTVCVRGVDDSDWRVETFDDAGPAGGRGLGVYDLAEAIRADREPACSGALAAHVVEAMQGVLDSAETGQRVTLQTRP
jgi:predicted dehydrogenase